MNSLVKQGFGASVATVGAATLLGWMACLGLTGKADSLLLPTGTGLILTGGSLLIKGRMEEAEELRQLNEELWQEAQKR